MQTCIYYNSIPVVSGGVVGGAPVVVAGGSVDVGGPNVVVGGAIVEVGGATDVVGGAGVVEGGDTVDDGWVVSAAVVDGPAVVVITRTENKFRPIKFQYIDSTYYILTYIRYLEVQILDGTQKILK